MDREKFIKKYSYLLEHEDNSLQNETEDNTIKYGRMSRRLRRVGGKLKIVRKRIKALPQSMRTISKAAAKRRAKKSAIKKIAQKRKITRKMLKTKKRAKSMGIKTMK